MNVIPVRRDDVDLYEPPNSPRQQDQGAQLRQTIAILRRRWRLIVPVAIVAFTAIYAYALLSPRIYSASALVMVNPSREQVLSQDQQFETAAPNSSAVDSEIEILRSPMLRRRLVERLKLDEDPEWNDALRPPSVLSPVLAPVTQALEAATNGGLGQSLAGEATGEDLRNSVANVLGRAVSVRRRGLSFGIDVTAESQDPRRAAEIANTLVQLYLDAQTEARFEAAQRANVWLSQRLEELRLEVAQKERAAEEFRTQHNLSIAAGGGASQPQSDEVQTMLVSAQADLAEKEARLRQVRDLVRTGESAESIGSALNSGVISGLRSQEAETARRLAELKQRYSDAHPAVQAADIELQNTRQRINEEVARLTSNLQNEVEVARARLATLRASFGSVTGDRDQDNEAVIQYRELVRQAFATRAVHESFLQRYHEVADQGELPIATSRLASNATPPSLPSKPNMTSMLLMALLLGALAGVGFAFLIEMLDGSMGSADDVERKVGVPAVASMPVLRASDVRHLPKFRRRPADYIVEKPMSGFAEALRVFRTAVLHARLDQRVRVLAITSAVPNEGKSTLSLCLARICAMSGQRVALVDCDLRRRSLNEMIGINPRVGLLDVLSGDVDWRDAMTTDPETSVELLPATASEFTPRDVFSSLAMTGLMDALRDSFDLVILDCPPVLAIAETRLIVTHADIVAMVARSDKTPAEAVRTALRGVHGAGADVLGIALNYVDPRQPGRTAYGDSLYYRHAGKTYYRS